MSGKGGMMMINYTNRKRITIPGILALVACWFAQPASAILIAEETFEDYNATNLLNGRNGGTGWTNAWSANSSVDIINTGGNLAAEILTPAGLANNPSHLSRRFDPSNTGGDVFLGIMLRALSFEDDDFIQFQLSNGATGTSNSTISMGIRNQPNNPFFARVDGSSNTTNSSISALDGIDYLLVAKFSKDGASRYNRTDLFINPVGSTEPVTANATQINPSTGMSQLSLFNVRIFSFEPNDAVILDTIRIATTFAEVVGTATVSIYEPNSIVLFATGLIGVCCIKRKRR